MKHIFSLISMISLFLFIFSQKTQAQEMNMIDAQNYYEIEDGEDGAKVLVVTMDGIHKTADFDAGSSGENLPRYLGKYKNSLIFVHEKSRATRDVMVFRPIDGLVWQSSYENDQCSTTGEVESCLFFYAETPIKVEYNRKGRPNTKFSKLNSKYGVLKGQTILSCGGDFQKQDE